MLPDAADLLRQFMDGADAGDLLGLLDFLIARTGFQVRPLHRYALAGELGELLARTARRGEAERRALNRLTDREVETLQRMAAGWSNQEIAEALGIKERTVRQHQQNMQNKLGVEGRGRLVARVYGLDFICRGSAETTMCK